MGQAQTQMGLRARLLGRTSAAAADLSLCPSSLKSSCSHACSTPACCMNSMKFCLTTEAACLPAQSLSACPSRCMHCPVKT